MSSDSLTTHTPQSDWHGLVSEAAQVLLGGGVVAYPSETVWGLAAHPESLAGIDRLVQVKGRDPRRPFQVSCVDAAHALTLAQDSGSLRALATLWPGPLSVVAPASAACPPGLAPGGRVGLRVPDHPVATALLRAAGGVLVTTSCNVSGAAPAATYVQAVSMALADFVLPDGGVRSAGLASTVVALPAGEIVREGSVGAADIRHVLDTVSGGPGRP